VAGRSPTPYRSIDDRRPFGRQLAVALGRRLILNAYYHIRLKERTIVLIYEPLRYVYAAITGVPTCVLILFLGKPGDENRDTFPVLIAFRAVLDSPVKGFPAVELMRITHQAGSSAVVHLTNSRSPSLRINPRRRTRYRLRRLGAEGLVINSASCGVPCPAPRRAGIHHDRFNHGSVLIKFQSILAVNLMNENAPRSRLLTQLAVCAIIIAPGGRTLA